ncbi:hypothetical protein ACROYT_G002586 [Oculina patagonica]
MAAVGRLGNVLRQNQENEHLLAAKAKFAKNARPRAALGDLGNNKPAALTSKTSANLGAKPKRTLHRAEATTGLLSKQVIDHDAKQQEKTIDMDPIGAALESCLLNARPANVVDIDKEDHSNPQLCAEYAQEIYQYMHKLECEFHVNPRYMSQRTEIKEGMRGILVDWLIQVHNRFRLLQETLYITISILDRFLSVYDVSKKDLQLVGVSAMLLASKYEEMYCPEIGDFVYITDNTYTKGEIRRMEALIFKHVNFSVGKPLCLHFLRRNSKAGEVDGLIHTMAKYFMELCLVDYACVAFLPSEIAAASLYIAMKAKDGLEWTPTLEFYSMYSESKLQPCARRIAFLITKTLDGRSKLKAVHNKFATSKFMEVSRLACLGSSFVTNLASEESQ